MVFGSHLGNWDHTDNIMRSVLATQSLGLTCCMSGVQHWFCHHMGLGETIGYSTRLSLNNSTIYQNQTNPFTRAVYIALMGDPTLRMEPVAPVGNLASTTDPSGVHLSWTHSAESVATYNIYRATNAAGPFALLNATPLSDTNFTDVTASPNTYVYMVRAVELQTNPSGSYLDPSEGVFVNAFVATSLSPIVLRASVTNNGLRLGWNSQAGVVYHVYSLADPADTNSFDLSGPLQATGTNMAWTDSTAFAQQRRFYRIGSP